MEGSFPARQRAQRSLAGCWSYLAHLSAPCPSPSVILSTTSLLHFMETTPWPILDSFEGDHLCEPTEAPVEGIIDFSTAYRGGVRTPRAMQGNQGKFRGWSWMEHKTMWLNQLMILRNLQKGSFLNWVIRMKTVPITDGSCRLASFPSVIVLLPLFFMR